MGAEGSLRRRYVLPPCPRAVRPLALSNGTSSSCRLRREAALGNPAACCLLSVPHPVRRPQPRWTACWTTFCAGRPRCAARCSARGPIGVTPSTRAGGGAGRRAARAARCAVLRSVRRSWTGQARAGLGRATQAGSFCTSLTWLLEFLLQAWGGFACFGVPGPYKPGPSRSPAMPPPPCSGTALHSAAGAKWSEVAAAHALLGYERREAGICPVVLHPLHGKSGVAGRLLFCMQVACSFLPSALSAGSEGGQMGRCSCAWAPCAQRTQRALSAKRASDVAPHSGLSAVQRSGSWPGAGSVLSPAIYLLCKGPSRLPLIRLPPLRLCLLPQAHPPTPYRSSRTPPCRRCSRPLQQPASLLPGRSPLRPPRRLHCLPRRAGRSQGPLLAGAAAGRSSHHRRHSCRWWSCRG